MQVEAIPMLINGDFLNAPLDVKMHLADYKMYGEDSYVFQQKELLYGLYECMYLSMNDRRINGEALEYLIKNKSAGKVIASIVGLENKEVIEKLSNFQDIANNSVAVQTLLNNPIALTAIINSPTAISIMLTNSYSKQMFANSTAAMQSILNSPKSFQVIVNNTTAMEAFANSTAAMQSILNSPKSFQVIVNNTTAMEVLANSTVAMQSIAKDAKILYVLCKSNTASQIIKNSLQNVTIRNLILNTLNNAPKLFSKNETAWYCYDVGTARVVRVVDNDDTIVIPTGIAAYYSNFEKGCLYYGADQSEIACYKGLSTSGSINNIDNIVSFRGLYFYGNQFVRTFATVFTARQEVII